MSAVTFRVDEALKAAVQEKLSAQGLALADVLRDTLAYIAETGRPPVRRQLVTDEDARLIEIVRERLAKPAERHSMTLEELQARHKDG